MAISGRLPRGRMLSIEAQPTYLIGLVQQIYLELTEFDAYTS